MHPIEYPVVPEMKNLRKIATPYSFSETAGVVQRNILGMDHRNHGAAMEFLPNQCSINPVTSVDTRIAFFGDIMSVGRRRVIIHESVYNFLYGCDYLVANLEANITRQRRRKGVIIGAFQWQDDYMVDVMADLFPPAATYLSVANNHAGDFEKRYYLQSCSLLEERGFVLFGQGERPYVDITPRIRLHAGTMWSNQICNRVHWLGSGKEIDLMEHGSNILFPHWGYELEKYPRPEIVNLAKSLSRNFDAILGHHPHTVQPVIREPGRDKNCLVAYSLGDFCTNIPFGSYRYGIIAKIETGPVSRGDYAVGNIDWRFIESRRQAGNNIIIRVVDEVPYFC